MARGILGDDGPSIWMMLSVVLVVGWARRKAKEGTDKVKDVLEIGKNSAGVFQSETTAEIEKLTKKVAAVPVIPSKLKYKPEHYKTIARDAWTELNSKFNINEGKLFAMFEKLTVYELKAVYHYFGIKEPSLAGIFTLSTLDLFKCFEDRLSDGIFGNDLTRMRKIWAKTGLWY